MISISKIVADKTNGNVILHELSTSDLKSKTARVSRSATLDGGVYITQSGVCDGDRTLRIEAYVKKFQENILQNMFSTQILVLVSFEDGGFLGVIENLNINNGILKLNILIKQRDF